MIRKPLKFVCMMCVCGTIMAAGAGTAFAATDQTSVETSTTLVAKVDIEETQIYSEGEDLSEVIGTAAKGTTYDVLGTTPGGWIKIGLEDGKEGFIYGTGNATILEETEEEVVDQSADRRQALVDYALQFVGGRYRYGGNDPHTGVDCSGFTKYVLQHGAGVSLNRSSGAQSGQGTSVSSAEMLPGDLLFYGSGRSINHVAMYIGNGQVVHASTYATGIKISDWNYRSPVVIKNVIGE